MKGEVRMKYIVTQSINCALVISNTKQLEIDGFTFLREDEGNNIAKYIQTEVEANTTEEAQRKAGKLFSQFLFKLTVLDNSKYTLLGNFSVSDGTITTKNISFMVRAAIGVDGDVVKDNYVEKMKNKRLRMRPLRHYSDGINSTDIFEQYRNFYLVLENYLKNTPNITNWIKTKLPKVEIRKDVNGTDITIFSWIRHRLSHAYKKGSISSHSKRKTRGLNPLSISNPEHVLLVRKH